MSGARCALLGVAVILGWAWLAPAGALGAVGDLTFTGCIGMDLEMGCAQTTPSYLLNGANSVAMSPDGASVYVTASTGSGTGLIDGFSRNTATGALSFEDCIGDGAGSPCTATSPTDALGEPESVAVSPDGRSVYVASPYAGAVDVLSRDTTSGALTYSGCIGVESGCTATTPANALSGAASVAVSPDGTSVYVGASNAIDLFERNTSSGALTFESCIGEDAGCTATTPTNAVLGVRSVAVSPDGKSLYAANSAFGAFDLFSRNTTSGALTFNGCIGEDAGCTAISPVNALDDAGSIAVSPDGASVYVAVVGFPGPGGIVAFSRDTASGALTYTGCFGADTGCTATTPSNALEQAHTVAVSPDGASVYAASEGPNAVALFARNTSTGALTYESCIGNDPGCTATSPSDALDDANAVVVSPEGSNVYAASGAALNDFSRAAAPPGAGSPPPQSESPTPPSAQITHATLDDQQIALTTPSLQPCVAGGGKLAVTLDSSAIAGSGAAKLSFSSAAFYLDNGIRHTHKKTTRTSSGRKKTVIVATYKPNAIAKHVPVTLELSTAGLTAGTHTLTVKVSYKETKRKHGHKISLTLTKTLTAQFTVC